MQLELNRPSAAYTSPIGDAIISAIRYYEGRPVWFTEESTTLNLLINTNSVALPSNFKSKLNLLLPVDNILRGEQNGFKQYTYKDLRDRWDDTALTNIPTEYAFWDGNVVTNCLAVGAYTLQLDYYKGDTTYPSGDADTSIWFDEGQDLIAVKAQAMFYRRYQHDRATADEFDLYARDIYNSLLERSNMREQDSPIDF